MRRLTVPLGLGLAAAGILLALFPLVTAEALDRPHAEPTQLINLRASFGGTLLGLGAFVAWLPAPRPWGRALQGLLLWAMTGIAAARLLGFVLDGSPDTRQWIWLVAELVIAGACAILLRRARHLPPVR